MWHRLIITFHYVNDRTNYHSITSSEFVSLLDWLATGYEFVSLYELIHSLMTNDPKSICCLTFDDGFQDHYHNIFPVLKERNIRGHFYLSALPYIDKKATDIHLTHALQHNLGEEKLGLQLQKIYKKYDIEINLFSEALGPQYSKWSSPLLSNIKISLKQLSRELRSKILFQMFKQNLGDPDAFCRDLYLSPSQIKEMEKGGMFFGNHGYSHFFMAEMNRDEQYKDIYLASTYLQELVKQPIDTISYPFGSYDADTLDICERLNFVAGLTVKRGDNKHGIHCLELKRMDVKEVCEYAWRKSGKAYF